jgi:hypothetical protein
MKQISIAIFGAILVALSACATLGSGAVKVGDPESVVLSRLGTPTHQYQDGKDRLLEYMHGPMGQRTYIARIGPDGRLISYKQVLTMEKFATLKLGSATKEDVLRTIGAPSETTYLRLSDLEVWSYPYKEAGVWDSIMSVHFDRNGVVQRMQNGPDPRRDPDSRIFGMMLLR